MLKVNVFDPATGQDWDQWMLDDFEVEAERKKGLQIKVLEREE